jgi:hypothetical protein
VAPPNSDSSAFLPVNSNDATAAVCDGEDGRRTLSTVLNRLEQVLARYHHSNLVQQFPNCNDAGGGVVSL